MPSSRPATPTRERSHNAHSQQHPQLSLRRGSLSAPDPYGRHATPPPRSTLSKLVIVRAPSAKDEADRKRGRTGSLSRSNSARSASPSRLSFASASFATPGRPQSPTIQGHHRRSSSTSSTASCYSVDSFARLSASQVYELGTSSSHPAINTISPLKDVTPSFSQLDDHVYLPFLERPAEVKALLASPCNAKVMVLLSHCMPNREHAHGIGFEPEDWTFDDLKFWLTRVPRKDASDVLWVVHIRRAVLSKSEVLWERMKSILGIPPELDADIDISTVEVSTLGTFNLTIEPIRPRSPPPSAHLDGISEEIDDEYTLHDFVLGLRISTPLSLPTLSSPPASAPTSPMLLPTRVRTTSHGSVPTRSSPLVPKPSRAPTPPGILPVAQVPTRDISCASSRTPSRPRPSKLLARPLFPLSFDKIGLQPTLLSVK